MRIHYPHHQGSELWQAALNVINRYFGEFDYYEHDDGEYDKEKGHFVNEKTPTIYTVWVSHINFDPNKPENKPEPGVMEAAKFKDWGTEGSHVEFSDFYLGFIKPVEYSGLWSFDYKSLHLPENFAIPDLKGSVKTKIRRIEHEFDRKIRKLIYEEGYGFPTSKMEKLPYLLLKRKELELIETWQKILQK